MNASETASGQSLDFASGICALYGAGVSGEATDQVKLLLLDHVAVALRGARLPWGRSVAEIACLYGASGRSPIFGSEVSTSPPLAAMANATAAHGLEMDDTHDASITHPGAVVIAAALATGLDRGASGKDILSAIACGYEVMARAGMATNAAEIIEHGFHPTALFGGFGSVTAGGLLAGFDAERLARAWGLMLSMAGGSMQFAEDPKGTTVKRLHAGYGAHNGLMAVALAERGIDGPVDALAGEYGLLNIYGRKQAPRHLAFDPQAVLEIHRISLKPYPCCRLFHSTIDALSEVTDGLTLPAERIRAIRVGGPTIMVTQHMMPRPTSVMAAQYSLPFTLGAALHFGPASYDAFDSKHLDHSGILAVADTVSAEISEEMNAVFPEHFGSVVEIETTDGETRRETVRDSLGTPVRPMGWTAVNDKMAGLLDGLYPGLDLAGIANTVAGVDGPGGPGALIAAVSGRQNVE